jgi:moderate conductance mechanosensitive channel
MNRVSAKHFKAYLQRRISKVCLLWVAIVCLAFAPIVPALAQTSQLPSLDLQPFEQSLEQLLDARDVEVATGRVMLDGYTLFSIAAPVIKADKNKSDSPTPVAIRRQTIERQLNRIANSSTDATAFKVASTTDKSSGLPVISVDGQYLMTVTMLDAQLQSSNPQQWATELASITKNALIRARQQRQPRFLMHQGLMAGGLVLILLGLSRLFALRQQHLKIRRQQLKAENLGEAANSTHSGNSAQGSEDFSSDLSSLKTTPAMLARQQRRNLMDLRLRTLQIAQVGLWGCGAFAILGFFAQTRWLRPILLSTPLQLLGIALGIYLLMRLSDVLVDRLFKSILSNEFIPPEASQRLALRISTVARVVKSTATLFWIGGGILAGLALLGVNLLPLLAGAGIIGLALSFAAQSVIKDVINGFLILFEDQYAVGDVIAVGDVGGLVENINLRITQLRNSEGMLITIPNSQISTVQNLSQGWSRVDLTVQIGHDTDPDHALQVLKQLAEELYRDRQWRSKLIEPPEILGIDALDHVGMSIRIWIKTQPLQQWVVAREFRRRLQKLMEGKELSIGMPQQSLWLNKNSGSSSG